MNETNIVELKHTHDAPPSGWYRSKLLVIKEVTTKKGKEGLRFEWEAVGKNGFVHTAYQTFAVKNGLLSMMTCWWLGRRISAFPKKENGAPDLSQLICRYADILIENVNEKYSRILHVRAPKVDLIDIPSPEPLPFKRTESWYNY